MGTRRRTEEEAAPTSALGVEVHAAWGPGPLRGFDRRACVPLLLFPWFSRWGRPPGGGEVWRDVEAAGFGSRGPRLKGKLDKKRASYPPPLPLSPPGPGVERRALGVRGDIAVPRGGV